MPDPYSRVPIQSVISWYEKDIKGIQARVGLNHSMITRITKTRGREQIGNIIVSQEAVYRNKQETMSS